MRHQIILVRCPSCGSLSIDRFSLWLADARDSVAVGNSQSCTGCRRVLPMPDQFRGSDGSLHIVSGRGSVEAFIVQLVSGARQLVDEEGKVVTTQVDYSKLPPFLKVIYDLAQRYGYGVAALFILVRVLDWAQPFIENFQEHWLDSRLLRQEHRQNLELAEAESQHAKDLERLRRELSLQLKRDTAQMESLSREERELVEWLRSMPQFRAAEPDESPQAALRNAEDFVNRFNQINMRLRQIESRYRRSLIESAGHAGSIVAVERKPPANEAKSDSKAPREKAR